jgi:eukaryotic-like serine/threonine-protein kinase
VNLEGPIVPASASEAAAPRTLRVQTPYRLVRPLGTGGMAVVYLAVIERDHGFSRNVALKLVRDDYAQFPEFAKLFASEASLAAKLTHPNIVGVFDYCHDARERSFLVMEVVNGISLRALIHHQPAMPFPVVTFVLAEVLRGLGYAHRLPQETGLRGLLHCDISPHNILLSWEGAVKLSDFGIARALKTTSGMITGSEGCNGKPGYMSPEQVNNTALDRRSDLFSLGVVFWEMLSGAKLFRGVHPSEIFHEVATRRLPLPSAHRRVPRELERIAMKLLERDLERRYACAEDVLADLMRCRQMTSNGAGELGALLSERFPPHARDHAEPGAPGSNQHTTASASLDGEALAPRELRPRGAARRRLLAAGVAGLVLGAAVAIAIWRSSEQAPAGKEGSAQRGAPASVVVPASSATDAAAGPPMGVSGAPAARPSLLFGAPRPPPPLAAPSSASGTPSKPPGRGGVRTAGSPSTAPPSGIVEIPLGDSSATRKP